MTGRIIAGVLLSVLPSLPGGAEEETAMIWSAAPRAELLAAARGAGVFLDGLQLGDTSAAPVKGDTVTLLIELEEGGVRRQWLAQLSVAAPGAEARDAKRMPDTIFYGMDGSELRFAGRPLGFDVVAVGPHPGEPGRAGPSSIRADGGHVTINGTFLVERFDRAADFMYRVGQARREQRLGEDELFTVLPQPPGANALAERSRFEREAGMTAADERAFAATVPALSEFIRAMIGTPGLREIFFAVIEKPSIWSVIVRWGRIESEFRFKAGGIVPFPDAPAGLPGVGPCHAVPFTLSINDKPALECTILVAAPRPPLASCAGIVGLVATSPLRNDARLTALVIAGRPGRPEPE